MFGLRNTPSAAGRGAALVLAVIAALFLFPSRADAHVALSSSEPADGASVTTVNTITLTFSKSFSVVSPGIQLIDATGKVVPTTLNVQPPTVTLTPEQPLASGAYGVRWTVKAPDSHARNGSFAFTVTGTTATPVSAADQQRLAAALRPASSSTPFDVLGAIGRFVLYSGIMLVIGALGLAFFVARATAGEAFWLVRTAQRAALLIGIGTIATILSQVSLFAGPGIPWPWKIGAWFDALFSMWGLSTLGFLAATALMIRAPKPTFDEVLVLDPSRVSASAPAAPVAHDAFNAGRLDPRSSAPLLAAVAILLVGLAINGHSQSSSPLVVAWIANIIHVLAAGVWSGGVIFLLAVIMRRRRAKNPALIVAAPLQFSRLATIASVAAGLSGIVLAIVELPSFGALFTTSFGRILIAKTIVVGAIAAIGAMHHFRLLPALQADPSAARVRNTWRYLRIEALGFVLVIALTAFLVNASYV
jgi:copper transport protein